METPSQYSSASRKSFLFFLFIVILILLGVIGYFGLHIKDLEKKEITSEEAQLALDQLPDNPDASGLSPQDRAKILEGLSTGE